MAGRPRKITQYLARKIFVLFGYGLTDQEIADTFELSRDTIAELKKKAEYSDTIARARDRADRQVVNSLLFRAKGYSHPEEKIFTHLIESEDENGNKTQRVEVTRVMTVRHYPPDTNAIGLYLINRKPRDWKPASAIQRDQKPLDDDNRVQRNLTQIFVSVREKETVAIRSGEDELEVLFGKDAAKQLKEKNGIGNNNP